MHRPHKHLILDALVKNPPKDEVEIKKFLAQIIVDINMVVADLTPKQDRLSKFLSKIPFLKVLAAQPNPIAWYCDDPTNRGLTAGGILTTSHIMLHVWDDQDPAPFHFDLYSCSDFDPKEIVKLLDEKFGMVDAKVVVIDRQNFTAPIKQYRLNK